ncbi:MAG TPA: MFS transporter [Candidatus Binataceae bacterium]|nr:MFS transporter [Candidatus Binataceae bacterium]
MSVPEFLESARSASVRPRAPTAVLFATVFVDLLGFGIVIPFLPMYAARMGIGAFKIGMILSIYSLMQFLAAPILGRISDRVGRRPIIMLGLLGSSVSYLIYGFANSFVWLLLSRGVHGACAATVSTAQAYVADTTTETERTHGMGMIGAAFGLGFVLGPAIGGLLGHSSLRVPAFVAAAITFANLIFAATSLPESHRSTGAEPFHWSHLAQPLMILPRQLARHRLARFFLIAFLATFAMAIFETTFALIAPLLYGYHAAGVGGLFAFAGVVQAVTQGYLLGKLVKLVGEKRLIRVGLLLFAIGMAPLASFRSSAMLLVLLALLALGYGFANPAIASLISKRSGRHLQGEVLGVNQSALALARIVGPIVAGILYDTSGPLSAYIGGALAAIIALVIAGGIDPAASGEALR